MNKKNYALLICVLILIGFASTFAWEDEYSVKTISLQNPITHSSPVLGNYTFVLSSGNVFQNGSAYSYVRLNATALFPGDTFTVFPALNVGFTGTNENNFTAILTFTGSTPESHPYWINFSIEIPQLNTSFNASHLQNLFSRSNYTFVKIDTVFFTQVSNVVGVGNEEFEFFFYIGSDSTPAPILTHGPVD